MTGHIDPTKETFAAFRADDRPGPINMLNLVRLRALAAYPDGRAATGAEACAAYGRDERAGVPALGGEDRLARRSSNWMLIGPTEEALGSLLHRPLSERRRLRRDDPRSRLSRSCEASSGRG